jgi:hypothetical protein
MCPAGAGHVLDVAGVLLLCGRGGGGGIAHGIGPGALPTD